MGKEKGRSASSQTHTSLGCFILAEHRHESSPFSVVVATAVAFNSKFKSQTQQVSDAANLRVEEKFLRN
jgi:hypothetical protein